MHISDETGRFVLVETTDTTVLTRYQHSDHLGSSCLETDENGVVISYEEYHPFGTTAYQATLSSLGSAAKRYRFCGKERDEESGLYYYGARYYASWLGRFVRVDPKESKYFFQSSYAYAENSPVTKMDFNGEGSEENDPPKVRVLGSTGTTVFGGAENADISEGTYIAINKDAEEAIENQPSLTREQFDSFVKDGSLFLITDDLVKNLQSALEKSNADGGFHEEGGIIALVNGKIEIFPTDPGPTADPSKVDHAEINFKPALEAAERRDPNNKLLGTYHIHPKGSVEVFKGKKQDFNESTVMGKIGKTETHSFEQVPSEIDYENSSKNPNLIGIVLGAATNQIIIYKNGKDVAKFNFSRIKK